MTMIVQICGNKYALVLFWGLYEKREPNEGSWLGEDLKLEKLVTLSDIPLIFKEFYLVLPVDLVG